jgi:hypothetical protein
MAVIQERAHLRKLFLAGCVALPLAALMLGCGAEKQTITPNPTPTAVPVQGMSQDDYAREMQNRARQMGGAKAFFAHCPLDRGAEFRSSREEMT